VKGTTLTLGRFEVYLEPYILLPLQGMLAAFHIC
jgi:hypothetical protein